MKRILFFSLFIILFLGSCNSNVSYNDDHIPLNLRLKIAGLNNEIIEGLSNNQPDKILAVCSDELLKSAKNDLNELIAKTSGVLKSSNYKVKNEFYIEGSSKDVYTSAITGLRGDYDYQINFKAVTKESYVSVGEFKDSLNTVALTAVFGKYDETWKLNILRIGDIEIYGLNAIDWFEKSSTDLGKGYIADAANEFQIASKIAKPAGEIWVYHKEKEMETYQNNLKSQINKAYSFPIEYSVGPQTVSIIGIGPRILTEGITPMIRYVTTTNLSDTLSLSKECDHLHKDIGKIFKGIDINNKAIIYKAFNKMPKGEHEESYGFVRMNKNG